MLAAARPAVAQRQDAEPLAGPHAGQVAPVVSVTREPGADDCPDSRALLSRIEQLRGRPEAGATVAYHVVFAREGTGLRAEIRSLSDPSGARVLRDEAQTCGALEQATAVTLALLLDADARASTFPASPRLPANALPSVPRDDAIREAATKGDHATRIATLALGGGALIGVLRPVAPALSADIGLRIDRLRVGLGGLYAPALAIDFAGGTVRQSLLSGSARACLAPLLGSALRLDICSGLWLGALHAEAEGYRRDGDASKAWIAIPIELVLASTPAALGLELSAAVLLPWRRQDFAIDYVGVAYESWPLAVLLTLRGVAGWSW